MSRYFNVLTLTCLVALHFSHCELSEKPTCSVVQGLPGLNGRDGRDGSNGQKGDQGLMGQTGPPGLRGANGPPGKVGPPGQKGIQGDKGSTGIQGTKGEKGPPGIKGEMGASGAKGAKGDPDSSMALKVTNLESKIADLEKSVALLRRVCYAHSGVTTHGNKIYVATTQEGDYSKAKALCRSYQGKLPTPLSGTENTAVLQMSRGRSMFLGINDINNEGTWVDEAGKTASYRTWEPKEPNGGRNENCAEIKETGGWNDCACNRKNAIGCEFQS